MKSHWPAASRLSSIQPRTPESTCHKFSGLAARLAQRSFSSWSTAGSRKRWLGCSPAVPSKSKPAIWSLHNRPGSKAFTSPPLRRVITAYEELPKNYKDTGVAFSLQPLTQEEAVSIFGKIIDANAANRLLSVLHGRRVAGTLQDPDKNIIHNPYEDRAFHIGLAWLRENVPVDEIRSAGIAAENELAAMEADIISDSERLGLYRPNSTPRGKGIVYGKGVLERVREHNQKVQAEKDAQEAEKLSQADEIQQNTGPLAVKTPPISKVELRRPGENPKLKYYLERAQVLPNSPPEMSILQRLWPSGVLVACVVLGGIVFAQVYQPPKRSDRLMPEIPPAAATYIGLLLVNFAVFIFWHHPPAFRFLNKYFVTTPGYPYPLSLIGNIFSHQSFTHLATNMTVLYFVGTRFHDEVGRGNFLAIYVATGALGSFASLSSWVIRGSFVSSSLGASGALAGIIAAYLWLHGGEAIKFFGVFPPDSWPLSSLALLLLMMSMDVYGLSRWNKATITLDHWAHLGGYASGICSAELLRLKAKRRRFLEEERKKNESWVDKVRNGRL